jgi:hypothetical protein
MGCKDAFCKKNRNLEVSRTYRSVKWSMLAVLRRVFYNVKVSLNV